MSHKWENGRGIVFTSWVLLIFSCPISATYFKWVKYTDGWNISTKVQHLLQQNYLKSREKMKAFKKKQELSPFFFFFFSTASRWYTITTNKAFKFQFISTKIGWLFGFIMDQSPQISVVFVPDIPKWNQGRTINLSCSTFKTNHFFMSLIKIIGLMLL